MKPIEKNRIFAALRALLRRHAKRGVVFRTTTILPTAGGKKPAAYLYGVRQVSILGREPQQTYVAGIIRQKHFVGFYSMPIYSHPKKVAPKHPALKRMRKGKSCINVTRLDAAMLKDLDRLIRAGITLYKKEGWI